MSEVTGMRELPEVRAVREIDRTVEFRVSYQDYSGDGVWWELYWDRAHAWNTYDGALAAIEACFAAPSGTPGKRNISKYEIYRVTSVAEIVTR